MEPSAPVLAVFPCWAVVSQMGHKSVAGRASLTAELGTPMIVVEVPAAAGDETHEELPAHVELIAPASLYGVRVCSEAEVLRVRLAERSRIYRPYQPRQIEAQLIEAAEAADELLPPRAHPRDCDCDDCIPL